MRTEIAIVVGTIGLFFPCAASAQNPPATTERIQYTEAQCVADAEAWQPLKLDKTSFTEIDRRFNEMIYCSRTYKHLLLFDETLSSLAAYMLARETDFISRHKLWDKFNEEDAAEVRKHQR